MLIGISLASAHPDVADVDAPRRMIERARVAAEAGLATLTVGDHHVTGPMPYVQNVPIVGRLIPEWGSRPIGALFLVPLWNAVLMAEQIGTLAAMADGPFIVQTGLGDRGSIEAMGLDVPHRGERLEATIEVVQALLAGERVDDARLDVRGAQIAPRPPQPVEWWIGASTPPAIDRAARLGTCWYGNANIGPDETRQQFERYAEACERHGKPLGRTAVRKDVLVLDDDAEATRVGDALIEQGYRGFPREAVAYGDPEHVAEQLAVYRDLGISDVITRTMFVPQEQALESIALTGRVAELLEA